MSKRINQMTTSYTVKGMAVKRSDKSMSLEEFEFESDSKNAITLRKMAADLMGVAPRDIMVTDVIASRSVHQYKVCASVADIIAACKAAGLEVIDMGYKNAADDDMDTDADADTDTDESEYNA